MNRNDRTHDEVAEIELRIQFLSKFLKLIEGSGHVSLPLDEKHSLSRDLETYVNDEPFNPAQAWQGYLISLFERDRLYVFNNRIGRASAKKYIPYFESYLQGQLQIVKREHVSRPNENSIEIKIPTRSMNDLLTDIKNYRNALEPLVVDNEIKGKMELVDCRSGSVWLEFLTYSQAAVTFIGGVVYASYYIINRKKNVQFSDEQIKLYQISNELQQSYAEALKKELNKLIEVEAQALCKKHLKKADNEKIAHVRTSIRLLAGLFEEGGQVIAGSGATQKQKESFPDLKNLQNLVSMVKQIEGGADTETEE